MKTTSASRYWNHKPRLSPVSKGIMPTFQGLLRDREISALIEFIKTRQ